MTKVLAFSLVFSVIVVACNRSEKGADPVVQTDQGAAQAAPAADPAPPDTPTHQGMVSPSTEASAGGPPIMQKIIEYKGRLDKNPKDLEALVFLGNANFDIQRFEKAQEYYQRALAIDQNNTHIRTDLASSYRQTGETDQAIGELKKVLAQDPNQEIALYNLGVILLNDKEDREGAVGVWKKLVAIYRAKQAKYASLSDSKKGFLKAFGAAMAKSEGRGGVNIEEVAQASGIAPAEYHRWLEEDPLFAEALRNAKDATIADELEKKIGELEKGAPLKPQGS
jgi:tetratricopeptide (TPR) repeat protein